MSAITGISRRRALKAGLVGTFGVVGVAAIAGCGETVTIEKIVEVPVEVIKEVEVAGETVVKEVRVEVAGETVIKEVEVIKEVVVERAAAEAPAEKMAVEIEVLHSYWHPDQPAILEEIKDVVESNNPGLTIKFAYTPYSDLKPIILARLAGGKAPDVMGTGSTDLGAEFWALDPFIDLRPYLGDRIDEFVENSFDEIRKEDGKIIGVPMSSRIEFSMFLDIGLWEKAGVELPPDPTEGTWTWDQAIESAKKITNLDDNVWGWVEFADPPFFVKAFIYYFYNNETDVFRLTEDGTWRSSFDLDSTKESYHMYVGRVTDFKVAPESVYYFPEIQSGFGNHNVGMMSMGNWFPGAMSDYPDMKYKETFEINLPPVAREGVSPTGVASSGYQHITKPSQHPDEAWEYLNVLSSAEFMRKMADPFNTMPALKVWYEHEDFAGSPWHQRWNSWFPFARYYPLHPNFLGIMQTIVAPLTHEVLLGIKSETDAIKEMDTAINRELGFQG